MKRFMGMYDVSMDLDGRVELPEKLRFEGNAFAWIVPDKAVRFVPLAALELDSRRQIEQLDVMVGELEVDGDGRLHVPASFRDEADLRPGQGCRFVGMGNTIELWNFERLEEKMLGLAGH